MVWAAPLEQAARTIVLAARLPRRWARAGASPADRLATPPQGTSEWAQLLPYHSGPLLVLTLLSDGPPPALEVQPPPHSHPQAVVIARLPPTHITL